MDAGAATKFCKVIWNNENEFKKVVVHLRDLHGFTEFFRMIEKLVSYFKDTIYKEDMWTTWSVQEIVCEKHLWEQNAVGQHMFCDNN